MVKRLFVKAQAISSIPGVYYNYRRDNESSITHAFTGKRMQCSAWAWYYNLPLAREHFPGDLGLYAAKVVSAAVKAYAFSLLAEDLAGEERDRLETVIREALPYAGLRRPRDRFLAWAILHGHLWIARRYAVGKQRKEARKSRRAQGRS